MRKPQQSDWKWIWSRVGPSRWTYFVIPWKRQSATGMDSGNLIRITSSQQLPTWKKGPLFCKAGGLPPPQANKENHPDGMASRLGPRIRCRRHRRGQRCIPECQCPASGHFDCKSSGAGASADRSEALDLRFTEARLDTGIAHKLGEKKRIDTG